MKPELVLYLLRLLLCNNEIVTWMKEQAQKSETPIDDNIVAGIQYLLCPERK